MITHQANHASCAIHKLPRLLGLCWIRIHIPGLKSRVYIRYKRPWVEFINRFDIGFQEDLYVEKYYTRAAVLVVMLHNSGYYAVVYGKMQDEFEMLHIGYLQ